MILRKEKDVIQLSDHFDYKRLLRYCFPSMTMVVFTSIYGVVDGLFVSNFVGKNAFAAINIVMPALMILGALGLMFGSGGTALVAKTLGEKKNDLANKYFSMMIEFAVLLGLTATLIGFVFMPNIVDALGASALIRDEAVLYGRVVILFTATADLQFVFQSFMTAAEKPRLGLRITVAAGLTNMILDAVFVGVLRRGVTGAALATGFSQIVGGVIPLIYFASENDSLLRFSFTKIEIDVVGKAAFNGMSELMANIATSLVSMVYNKQLMNYAQENGVAAYGVIMYVQFVFLGMLFGYTFGSSPIISYHYGAGNTKELNNLMKRSFILEYTGGVMMFVMAQLLARPIASLFVGYDAELLEMTVGAFRIFLFAFILAGGNLFASSFFTALNNGPISAVISFMRTLVFELLSVVLLPIIFGVNGIWGAVAVAEVASCILSWAFLFTQNKKYHYLISK